MEKIDCLIIGSGPAGYTAAIYLQRAGVPNILIDGIQPGGQLTQTTKIENYPGYANGIDGYDLMQNMRKQAENLGADMRQGVVQSVDLSKRPFTATLEGGAQIVAKSIIVATGATAKYLGLPDEEKYRGKGVSACATCDGFFYRKKTVAVVGGGDTACEEASYLSNLAKQVYMIVRKDHLRASAAMRQRVEAIPNVKILYNTNTVGLYGDNGVEGAHLVEYKGTDRERQYDLPIDGFFLAIGNTPNTAFLAGQVQLDNLGYIVTENGTTAASVEGVFAAGDVANPGYKQAIVAAGTGCKAAIDVDRYLHS